MTERTPKRPHEHFCSRCYPRRRTNGQARGWWRCFDDPCTVGIERLCRKCQEAVSRPPQEAQG